MPEMKTSKRKEGANASATLCLQKEAAPKRNHYLRSRDDRKAGVELLPEEIKNSEEETVSLAHVKHSGKSTQLRAWVSRYHRKAS